MSIPLTASLRELKLSAMAEAYELQCLDPNAAHEPFDERLSALVEAERTKRAIGRAQRLTRRGNVKGGDFADLDYTAPGRSGLVRSTVRELASLDWVRRGHDLVLTGPTGIGKTFLAGAFARAAVRAGMKTDYWRLADLLEAWTAAAVESDFSARRKRMLQPQLLVLDEWLAQPLDAEQSAVLARIIEARQGTASTLIASPVPVADWLPRFADPTPGEAVVDRFAHLKPIELRGPSLRQRFGQSPAALPSTPSKRRKG